MTTLDTVGCAIAGEQAMGLNADLTVSPAA
jgi:hypothetical protein